jgi:hypothetical protein
MKKEYMKPSVQVVQLHHRTMLLTGTNKGYDVIGQGEDNRPAAARGFNGFDDRDDE